MWMIAPFFKRALPFLKQDHLIEAIRAQIGAEVPPFSQIDLEEDDDDGGGPASLHSTRTMPTDIISIV